MENDFINLDDLSDEEVLRLSKVGIIALIDEATKYQEVRFKDKGALKKIFQDLKPTPEK